MEQKMVRRWGETVPATLGASGCLWRGAGSFSADGILKGNPAESQECGGSWFGFCFY